MEILKKIIRFIIRWSGFGQIGYGKYPDNMVNDIIYFSKALNGIEGDYAEFGTADGTSFISFYNGFKRRKKYSKHLKNMKFWAFDSFEGLPEISGQDTKMVHGWKAGDYAYDEKTFLSLVEQGGVDLSIVETVKGFYDEVLTEELKTKISLKKIAIAYIDCDLYESTVPVLAFITDYIQDGTVICFNDWWAYNGHPERGEQLAFKEWIEKNPQFIASEFTRAGYKDVCFVINKR